jgi:putative integral membrane protein (TIGR02587 family)
MEDIRSLLKDSGRSIVGGLILGLPLLYTMETWWLAWRLPAWLLLSFALGGLVLILVAVRFVGWRKDHPGKSPLRVAVRDFFDLVLHSFVGAYLVLLLFGVIELNTPWPEVVRHAAVQVVPFGLGAAIANRALKEDGNGNGGGRTVRKEAATFAIGGIFFALPIAPTEEMELMAAHAGWWRLALVPVLAILLTYLALYELQLRGSAARSDGAGRPLYQVGEVFGGYVLALGLAALMLAGLGHFVMGSYEEIVQKTVVLSFVTSIGGAAARVVI